MKSGVKILVVDDEEMMRSLLHKILTRDGYRVSTASDGDEALQLLTRENFDLIISDIKMPKLNGFELLKKVKSEYPEVGMIMMTAFGDTFAVKDAMLLQADEYITKPFRSHEISLVVERAYWRLSGNRQKAMTVPSRITPDER